ncbi:glycosyltransferase family 9 protein [uncultured Ilyobacter sp.]|uniref:glycosyltransferase family 9 protein n=1 Tax=uncultured Ilyobacter sp. TaxID=544433 RepID=UPI0029C81ACB|nr:glycosyltransferase family 9 protein [uncultured Ilyobacter sp.]
MRVLVIRLSSIGDVILTTPVLKEFKKKYPSAIVDFMVLDKFKDSIEGCPYVDNLIIFDKKKYLGIRGLKKFSDSVKGNGYDYVFDLHSKLRSVAISRFIGAKTFRYRKRALWKTILVKAKIIRYRTDDTIVKNYFGALKKLEVEYRGEDLNFTFSPEDLDAVSEYRGFVVFAPGASKNTKKWTADGFGNLARLLKGKYGKKIALIGGGGDNEMCESINAISQGSCVNLAGKLSLKESGALLSEADFLVTNDSGPFHISRGVKKKAFVIFGPTDPNMFEYDQYGVLVYREEPCSPCSLHGDKVCPKDHFNCMKLLKAEDVLKIIEKNMGWC